MPVETKFMISYLKKSYSSPEEATREPRPRRASSEQRSCFIVLRPTSSGLDLDWPIVIANATKEIRQCFLGKLQSTLLKHFQGLILLESLLVELEHTLELNIKLLSSECFEKLEVF